MKLTGIGGHICAAHRSVDGRLHGHTWTVKAWFRAAGDAVTIRARLAAVLAQYDHAELPDALRWGEELAQAIGEQLDGCIAVDVERVVELIFARWERDQ